MDPRPVVADARHSAELARIEANYTNRDASGVEAPYRFTRPGYAFYAQLVEWSVLEALRASAVDLYEANALDVGCGTGYFAHRLLEFGVGSATGVDLMDNRIRAAQDRYPAVRFQQANAAALPFGDGAFDIVTQFVCFSSVLDGSLRKAIASEMWRVTRPGGIIISYDIRPEPVPLRIKRWLHIRRARHEGRSIVPVTPTVGMSESELRRMFPLGSLSYTSAGLDFELCSAAAHSCVAARVLAAVPLLRAHALGVMRKDGGGGYAA